MLLSTFKKNTIERCPFTYWLNGRWFLQIVDGDSGNLYIHIILYSRVLIFDLKHIKCGGGLGGGGGNIFLAFYAISNISRKNNSGNKKQNIFLFTKTIVDWTMGIYIQYI